MSRPLDGRHAVVTGGGHGTGAEVAEALAASGAQVTLLGREAARLEAQVQRCAATSQAQFVVADVTREDQVAAAFASATQAFGPVEILVNNAGIAESAPFTRTTFAQWQRTLAVNLDGVFLCTQQVFAGMLAGRRGRIVNIASAAGLRGFRYVAAYCAAKHAVVGLTRALAMEAATSGVTVNAVCPGYVAGEMTERTIANIVAKTGVTAQQALATLVETNPQGRLIAPAEVANAVLWLCLPGSESVNGQSIVLAGGGVT